MNNPCNSKLTHPCLPRSICAPWIVLLLLLALPASVQSQFNYTANNGTITITGYYGPGGVVTIPDTINGLPVTSIGYDAFYECARLTSVTIGNKVTSIADQVFESCTSLTNATIGTNVASIGVQAFSYCLSLTNITIPDSVTTIGNGAFNGCGLSSVTIPDRVTTIGRWAFGSCDRLSAITVDALNAAYSSEDGVLFDKSHTTLIQYPGGKAGSYSVLNSVTSIGDYAFEDCSSLINATIGTNVASIGVGAFLCCLGLTNITIPDSVTTIGNAAFCECASLTSVTIGNKLTSIADQVFEGCTSLTNITIPDSVTSIGTYGFSYCDSLTSITIPDSVTNIGIAALAGCANLSAVNVDALNPGYSSVDGVLFNKIQTVLVLCPPAGKAGSYTIPNSVTSIAGYSFHACSRLTSVTIPDSVTSIGERAFDGCSSLTNLAIPNSVTSIGADAFNSCQSLTEIAIPSSVTSVGADAFAYCTSLTSVTLPNSVTSIADGMFEHCWSLTSVTIPNSVTSIGSDAFYGCARLTSVTLPYGLTSIATGAFSDSGLTNLTISDSVTSLGWDAFGDCTSLNSVTIGSGVTNIGDYAFYPCPSLTGVYFAGNAPSLGGSSVFSGDNNATVYYLPGTTGWGTTFGGLPTALWQPGPPEASTLSASSITTNSATLNGTVNPNASSTAAWFEWGTTTNYGNLTAVTNLGSGTNTLPFSAPLAGLSPGVTYHFRIAATNDYGLVYGSDQSFTTATLPSEFNYTINNGTITITGYTGAGGAVTIPSTLNGLPVTSIGYGAFYECASLTSVTIGNKVTSIADQVFESCTSLTNVTIPNSVTNIGSGAFANCTNLTGVRIPDSVISIGTAAFQSCIALTSIPIGNGVTSIGDYAFLYCTRLTAITVDPLNPNFSSVGGVLFDKIQTRLIQCPGGKAGGYTIPDSVTTIGNAAFELCASLTNVATGNGVTSIAQDAFRYCFGLTSVTIGSGVTSIGDWAFAECTSLTALHFVGNAPSLGGSYVFQNDNRATVYYLPGAAGWGWTFGGLPTALWTEVPTIQASPQSQTAEAASAVGLRVKASSPLPLFYFWYLNATNLLSTGTNWQLELTNLQLSQSGAYTVVISNVLGAVTSAPVMLQVIAPVEHSPVPGVKLTGTTGSQLNVDYADSLDPAPNWTPLGSVSLTSTSQYYFDLTVPLPAQRFYRAWQTGTPGGRPSLDLHLVPAITLTGTIGHSVRVDAINQVGPTNAWVTLATVTLTNTLQLYFDTSAWHQPPRLYRLVQVP